MNRIGFVVGLALILGLSAPASAGEKFDSKVTLDFFPGKRVDAFGGVVESSKSKCFEGRKVTLYKQKRKSSKPIKVGSDVSRDETGNWGVEASPEERFYFARVKELKLNTGKCEGDESKRIEFAS